MKIFFISLCTALLISSQSLAKTDLACSGKAHPDYAVGFGVEHTYEGKISTNKTVTMVLSCDHRKLTISGALSQVISGDDFKYESGETVGELADLTSGELVINVNEDYNFDGFNDISTIVSNGSGNSAIDTYAIFLYSEKDDQFVFSKDLMGKENLTLNKKTKMISEVYTCGVDKNGEYITRSTDYQWKKNKLKRIGKIATCS